MDVTFAWQDKIVSGYGRALSRLSAGDGAVVLARAINHEGAKATTAVRRGMKQSTGLGKYGFAMSLVKPRRATQFSLQFEIAAKGDETNIAKFGAKTTKAGVSASPWGKRRVFSGAFFPDSHGRVYVRKSKARLPIRGVFGPNIARELARDPIVQTFNTGLSGLPNRVGHELERFLMAAAKTSW